MFKSFEHTKYNVFFPKHVAPDDKKWPTWLLGKSSYFSLLNYASLVGLFLQFVYSDSVI